MKNQLLENIKKMKPYAQRIGELSQICKEQLESVAGKPAEWRQKSSAKTRLTTIRTAAKL